MTNKNQMMADKLDKMELSQKARDTINNTDFQNLDEIFSGLETAKDVEEFIEENYKED